MDLMEHARIRHRQRRQSMSYSQQQAYLARPCAIAQGKRLMVETSPSNKTEQARGNVRNRRPQQKKKFQRDEGFRRRVSVFSFGWRMGQSVKMNTAYLSELILKSGRKRSMHSIWRYKNARRELMTLDIYHIKRTWRKVLRIRYSLGSIICSFCCMHLQWSQKFIYVFFFFFTILNMDEQEAKAS
ncbi:hypothetical protein RchiOBHm_Chr4g0441561 [Rosa chinensis]|uniref:Uncharacterized protein n=1 Tax=Rosa chinensis TaxID=74649 RepID=A0A2P6R3E1_ROSCH|nr:hypothetical protein RchiOBHm_Chr4g0441561 [Rosa chinensis]